MDKALKKSLEKKRSVRFNTKHPDNDVYDGVVIHIGKSLVVIREFRDFVADGIIAFPKKSIVSIRDSEFENCENTILKRSREINKAKSVKWLDQVNSIQELLEELSKRKIWPAVEQVKGKKPALYVGPILHVEASTFEIYCYDAAGKWEDIYSIANKDVLKVEFDSKYLLYFNDYMMSVKRPAEPVGF